MTLKDLESRVKKIEAYIGRCEGTKEQECKSNDTKKILAELGRNRIITICLFSASAGLWLAAMGWAIVGKDLLVGLIGVVVGLIWLCAGVFAAVYVCR